MKTKALVLVLGLFLAAGCARRVPLVGVPAASMKTKYLKKGSDGEEIGPVKAEFCEGDDSITSDDSDYQVGLMDEALAKAEKESGADYLKDVQFFSDGDCVSVEGTGMRVK